MKIKLATIDDYASIIQLYRQLLPEDPLPDTVPGRQRMTDIIQSGRDILVVAETDGRLVSSCYLNVIPNMTRNLRPYAVIENMITDERHRKRGIGKAVLQHAMEIAWKRGCYKVMLLTGAKDEGTLRFYRSCGLRSDTKTAFIMKKL